MSFYNSESFEAFDAEIINVAACLERENEAIAADAEEASRREDEVCSDPAPENSNTYEKDTEAAGISKNDKKTSSDAKLCSSVDVDVPIQSGSVLATKPVHSKPTKSCPTPKGITSQSKEKKNLANARKRKYADVFSDSVLPHPPESKVFNSSFKIPKVPKKNRTGLSEEQKSFLKELERDFGNRYTILDEDFKIVVGKILDPPIVENYFHFQKRPKSYQDRDGGYHQDRDRSYHQGRNRNYHQDRDRGGHPIRDRSSYDRHNRKPYSYGRQNHSNHPRNSYP